MMRMCGIPALICLAALGCNGARPAGTTDRTTTVRRDPALEAGLKGLEQSSTVRHVVAKGETLYAIGRKYGVPVTAIIAANPGIKPDALRIGQELVVPGAVAPAPPTQPAPVSGDKPAAVKATDRGKLRHPVAGKYRASKGSPVGVEFAVPAGSVVMASAEGKVAVAASDFGGLGPTVMVEHAGGMVTLYGGVTGICVKPGETVKRGEALARTGAGGLVFRVYEGSAPVNPAPLLK